MNWRSLPYVLLLIVFWFAVKMLGFNMSAGSFWGITLFIACMATMLTGFIKSMDIGTRSFKINLAISIFSVVLFTAFTRFIHFENLCFVDFILGTTVLVNAWVGPINSFAMALRNVQGNIGTTTNKEAL